MILLSRISPTLDMLNSFQSASAMSKNTFPPISFSAHQVLVDRFIKEESVAKNTFDGLTVSLRHLLSVKIRIELIRVHALTEFSLSCQLKSTIKTCGTIIYGAYWEPIIAFSHYYIFAIETMLGSCYLLQ